MRSDYYEKYRRALSQLGQPIYGLGAPAASGTILGFAGDPAYLCSLRFHTEPGSIIDVTTAKVPQGGTERLKADLLRNVARDKVDFPWTVTFSERLVMVPVEGVNTQFRVMESSTGDWIAAGGYQKRHIGIVATPGTVLDVLALTPTVVDFGDAIGPWPAPCTQSPPSN